jgi:hypothetical protein
MSKFLNKLDDNVSSLPSTEENKTNLMYSCARRKNNRIGGTFQDLTGLIIIGAICVYIVYKFTNTSGYSKLKLFDFAKNHEINKLLIGMMLLGNVKNVSNSLINNIILPIVEPLLPFLLCKLNIYYGPFKVEFGEFISDIIVFTINLIIIYGIFLVLS